MERYFIALPFSALLSDVWLRVSLSVTSAVFLGIFAVMLFFVAHHQTPKRLPGQLERVFQHVSRIVDFSTPTVTIGDRTGLSILPIFRRDPASRQRLSGRRSLSVLPRK